ncbi:hypothetical protein [Streptomyces sp. NPDC088554]|uniref:hypothetical protein n=1 Tax=Streptomyces sp. NPDC088554 TaxID=3365865 RepID=UPI00382D1919
MALSVAGCSLAGSGNDADEKEKKVNMQEAADRAEAILDGTLKSIDPPVVASRGPSSDSSCTDFKNDGTGTGKVTRRLYLMTIISAERRGNFLGVVERYWKRQGYVITAVRNSGDMPAVFADHDGFKITLEIGYKGQAQFRVSSPCVTESEVTEAPRETIDPDDPASKGLPYVRSDFWSSIAPVSSALSTGGS